MNKFAIIAGSGFLGLFMGSLDLVPEAYSYSSMYKQERGWLEDRPWTDEDNKDYTERAIDTRHPGAEEQASRRDTRVGRYDPDDFEIGEEIPPIKRNKNAGR